MNVCSDYFYPGACGLHEEYRRTDWPGCGDYTWMHRDTVSSDSEGLLVVVIRLAPVSSGVMVAMVTIVIFPLHFSLTTFPINSLQLPYFAVVLHPPPTLSRSLLTQSSHHILGLPHRLYPSTISASDIFISFSSPILSTRPAHFNLFFAIFLIKTVLLSNLHYEGY